MTYHSNKKGALKMMCDYKGCVKQATTKGFVSLREPHPKTGSKFMDVRACDEHKNKDSFFPYVEDAE